MGMDQRESEKDWGRSGGSWDGEQINSVYLPNLSFLCYCQTLRVMSAYYTEKHGAIFRPEFCSSASLPPAPLASGLIAVRTTKLSGGRGIFARHSRPVRLTATPWKTARRQARAEDRERPLLWDPCAKGAGGETMKFQNIMNDAVESESCSNE